jgi:hypothetical protein
VNFSRREDLEAVVLDAMRVSFAEDARTVDTPIHLSDLLTPRYAYWQRVKPKPLTDDEIAYFVSGRSIEDATWRLHGYEKGGARVEWGITFRPDWYTSIPVEFKSRRGWLPKDDTEALDRFSHYIEQAGGYAALTEQTAAWLWVLSLAERQADRSTKPEFRCYLIEWTKDELDAIRADLLSGRVALTAALELREHTPLKLCPAWKCGKSSRAMVTKPRCLTCQRDFEGEWGIQKHLDSKTGRGHTTEPAKYERAYVPRCKWFTECEPWTVDPERIVSVPSGAVLIAEPDEVAGVVE